MKSKTKTTKTREYSQGARAEAARETGERIVEAFLARFMAGWFDEITLDAVAADAGVTVQTVVRRFGGKEGLMAASLERLGDEIRARRAAPAGDLGGLIARLVVDYELTGDALMRMLALEQRHPALKAFIDYGRREHREWVTGVFAEGLKGVAGARRERAVDMLVAATDVYLWKLWRRDMGRGVAAVEAMMMGLAGAVLADISGRGS